MSKKQIGFRDIVLIVDDEDGAREALEFLLEDQYEVFSAGSGKNALQILESKPINLVLLDVNMPGMDGIETLSKIKERYEEIDVIMISAMNSAIKAVEAIKLGAYDYITKPFETDDILQSVKRVMDKQHLKQKVEFLQEELSTQKGSWEMISRDKKMREIKEFIKKVAITNSNVLISGESGTGKEVVARSIHFYSDRRDFSFVGVNCGAIPSELIESELFGHDKGAFTGANKRRLGKFEYADGGTIFLDEVSTLPAPLQVKLLRVLQERTIERVGSNISIKVDVRVIAASNVELQKEIKEGRFRKDLFFRLNVLPISLPPLRNRSVDIPFLANHFFKRFNKRFNKNVAGFSDEVIKVLKDYNWPGNIRELENLVERVVVLAVKDGFVSLKDLPGEIFATDKVTKIAGKTSDIRAACDSFERQFILDALKRADWNQTRTAKNMGIHRNTLIEKMRHLKIKIKED
ncbi:MAG: sigma-54-dependent transcriptional regulator [Thermodesulfobacteriota bacterium]